MAIFGAAVPARTSWVAALRSAIASEPEFLLQQQLEWQHPIGGMPDSMTNILFRPSISWSTSDGLSGNQSAFYTMGSHTITPKDPLSEEGVESWTRLRLW